MAKNITKGLLFTYIAKFLPMKKSLFLIIALAAFAQISSSQIKLHSNGNVSIATTTNPSSHNTTYIYGPRMMFGGYNGRFFKFDCSPSDPRWWSSTNKIVFYNTEAGRHCDIEAKSFRVASDIKYKTDITKIDNALEKVLNLKGVSYFWKSEDGLKSSTERTPSFGFIAQDIEKVIPEVVATDSLDYKSVDYLGLLPYLVESIKELDSKIETQEEYINELESQVNVPLTSGKNLIEERNASRLFTNQPNPFKDKTNIGYFVRTDAQNADIRVYDLNGKQILVKPIGNFGAGEINILSSELSAGMYLYSLLVDNIEIDTRKMILLNQ